jgi:hypothetical protein
MLARGRCRWHSNKLTASSAARLFPSSSPSVLRWVSLPIAQDRLLAFRSTHSPAASSATPKTRQPLPTPQPRRSLSTALSAPSSTSSPAKPAAWVSDALSFIRRNHPLRVWSRFGSGGSGRGCTWLLVMRPRFSFVLTLPSPAHSVWLALLWLRP